MESSQNKMGLTKGTIGTPVGLRRDQRECYKAAIFASLGHSMVRCIKSDLSVP